MEDKNIIPARGTEDEQDPPVVTESPDALSEEIDEDDAMHSLNPKPSAENMQQDGDDAIHKNYKPAPDQEHENDERDPDDAIHGH